MKAIFYVLALLVAGGAAYLSYDNLKKFEDQQNQKIAAIDENKKVTKQGDDEDAKLVKERAALDAATKDKADAEASIETLVANEKTLKRKQSDLDGTLDEQKAKFANLNEIQRKVVETLKEAGEGVTLSNLPQKVQELRDDEKAKGKKLTELQALVDAAQKNVDANQAEIGRLANRDAERSTRIRGNAMESVVTAVNEDWGFVIIGAGSNTGFTPQTRLLVKRDGRLIAEVKPSAIEPSQTIAEIDLETLAPGARIQPGDRVILANPATN